MFLLTGIIGGAIVGLMYSIGSPRPLAVFVTVEGFFTFISCLSWASTQLHFEDDKIVRQSFFLFETKHLIRDIKKVRFDRNEDSFGGIMPTVTIEFNNAKRIMLINFRRADINAILDRIKIDVPDIDEKDVVKKMAEDGKKRSNCRNAFRPGDAFIFGAGLIIAILFVVWWLLQKFWIR